MAAYNAGNGAFKRKLCEELQIPTDPSTLDIADENYEDVVDAWFSFWVHYSDGLSAYLEKVKEIESENIDRDVDMSKGNIIRRKIMERKKLQRAYQCPDEPWSSVDPKTAVEYPQCTRRRDIDAGQNNGSCHRANWSLCRLWKQR